jgi:hypothetical protein
MKPWRRSWRSAGSFRMLSIGARGLFREMMTELADDDGVIDCGAREPAEAVCFALGATRSDRQHCRKWLAELLADGCVVRNGSLLTLPGWHRYQAEQATTRSVKASKKPQPSDDLPTGKRQAIDEQVQPSDRQVQPSDRLSAPKGAESLTQECQRRGEERRGEESATHSLRGRVRPCSSIDCPDPLGEYDTVSSLELPWRAWLAVSRARGMRPTDADRRRDMTHVESIERRVLELAPEMSEARGWDDHGRAARSIAMGAMRRFGELYDASHAPDFRGKPLAWRLGFVVARWAELTKDAIPAARAT